MGHIHTNVVEYDFTVGAYIIRKSPKGYEALLHLHKKLGKWLPFGGHIELNETPWQAVIREIKEESGYESNQLQIIQPQDTISSLSDISVLPQPVFIASYDYDAEHNHTDIAYAFLVDIDPPGATLIDESSDFRWFDSKSLANLSPEEIFSNTVEVYDYVLKVLDRNWLTQAVPRT